MPSNEPVSTWKGYAVDDTKNYQNPKVVEFKPKTLGDNDVEIAIEFCGVCGSDTHSVTGGWGPLSIKPLIAGHEIVGHVTQVGSKVKEFKKGDRAGVGAQVQSCMKCDRCTSGNENYCTQSVDTYNAKYENGDIAHGGFSTGIRAHEQFVFKIPDGLSFEQAAPMMCGGLTVYSPLKRHGCKPGARVAVVGIGGLGHYAVQFAKAMGAKEVIAISHSESKKEDALKMGATKFVVSTADSEKGIKGELADLDLIINTVDLAKAIPLADLLSAVKVHGRIITVGLPNDALSVQASAFAANGALLGGSHIGSKAEIVEMLQLAVEKGVKTWVVSHDMKDCGKAMAALKGGDGSSSDSDVRYRQVLRQDIVSYQ